MLNTTDFIEKQIIFALLSYGDKLSFRNDNIIIKDKDDAIKHQSSCYRLFVLFIVGHASITTGLLQKVNKFGFTLVMMGHNLNIYAIWNHKTEGNVLLRRRQYDYHKLDIAQHLIANKIDHQIAVLKKLRDKQNKDSIDKMKSYRKQLPDDNISLQKLLGIEGISSRVYFQNLFSKCNWKGRKPRTKQDPSNTLLDIGYTLLFNFIEALLNLYGFDIYQGVYHKMFYQRKSLVCDLVEPFRPIIDSRISKAYHLKQIKVEDFSIINGQYRLFGKTSKPYVSWLLEAILEHKKPMFIYIQHYYRAFMKDKPISEYPYFRR